MSLIGYQRVSTDKQNTEAQQRALEQAGCVKIFTDHAVSGSTTSRPEFDKAMLYLREGDTLVVWKLDRLGRSTAHLLQIMETLKERKISFRSVNDKIETDALGSHQSPMAEAMFTIMAAFAKLERDLISERTKAGLETARKHGRVGGRKSVTARDQVVQDVAELKAAGRSVPQIMESMRIKRSTVYKYLKIYNEA